MYAGAVAVCLLGCILFGLWRYRSNMKKRRSPYEQWIDYADAKHQGRKYRADTVVREPPPVAGLPARKQKEMAMVEMQDVIPAHNKKFVMEHDLRTNTGAAGGRVTKKAMGSISDADMTDFYRLSRGKLSSGNVQRQGVEEVEEGGDRFGDGGGMASPAVQQPRIPKVGKSASVFGAFNPFVVGNTAMSPSPLEGTQRPVPVALKGAQVANPLNTRISKRIDSNLSTPVQSPVTIAAARASAERIDEHGFEDDEDDDEGEGAGGGVFYGSRQEEQYDREA